MRYADCDGHGFGDVKALCWYKRDLAWEDERKVLLCGERNDGGLARLIASAPSYAWCKRLVVKRGVPPLLLLDA